MVGEPENGKSGDAGKPPGNKNVGLVAVIAIVVVAIVVTAGIIVLYSPSSPNEEVGPSVAGHVVDVNMTTVSVPLSDISQTARWYEYNVSGSPIRFFVVRDSNDSIHAAFDECWMCYPGHLGYRQNGADMIENCCNMSFPITSITKEGCAIDDCAPIFLPTKIIGDQLVITKSDLAKQKFIFLQSDETSNVHLFDSAHVAIPLSLVGENATWYQYAVNNTKVRFFAVTDADGTVHTALDVCWKCYKKHAGFRQQAPGVMVENCCNMAFSVSNITEEGCSIPKCHPVYIENHVIGDEVVIAISDLEAGSYMFFD